LNRLPGIVAAVLVVVAAAWFAALNGAERVTLRLGITTLYYVPLSLVAFGSLLVGMVIMFVVGVRSDLRVRRILRERFMDEEAGEPGRRDRNQVDLFTGGSP
jgi:uncharacterized integral membrane protein